MYKVLQNLINLKTFIGTIRKIDEEVSDVYKQIDEKVDNEIRILKDNSINYLINMHPKFYRESLKFEDWDSSMSFLEENKEEAFNFWEHTHD
tara:strand:+ start:84 stop:359 length:276 start_codon:yes stop_codon:yes gene_type:complete